MSRFKNMLFNNYLLTILYQTSNITICFFFSMHINWLISLDKMLNKCLMKNWPTHYFIFKLYSILHATREYISITPRICLFICTFFRQYDWKLVNISWALLGRMFWKTVAVYDKFGFETLKFSHLLYVRASCIL